MKIPLGRKNRYLLTVLVIGIYPLLGAGPAESACTNQTPAPIVTDNGVPDPHNIPLLFECPTISSAKSGNWSDPATWMENRIPGSGDDVHIMMGHTVLYDAQSIGALRSLTVYGKLEFSRTVNTRLHVGYFLVPMDGTLEIGTPAAPLPANVRAEIIIADHALDLARDPSLYGTGLLVLGRISLQGALKTTFLRFAQEPRAGGRTLVLESAPQGWQPGDRLIIPDTREVTYDMRNGFHGNPPFSYQIDEVLVESVNGSVVTLSAATPLLYDHFGAYVGRRDSGGILDRLPHVMNLTRNIVIRSENPAGTRGHTLFAHRAWVHVEYVEVIDMGRTTDQVVVRSGATSPTANQIGRYPFHMHHLMGPMPSDPDKPTYEGKPYQAVVVGNSVHSTVSQPPKGFYIIHQTHYILFRDNVGYNARGTGFYTEDGPEKENRIEHNMGVRVDGHGGRADRDFSNIPATDGSIFYFRGPMNRILNNVACNTNAYGFIWFMVYGGTWNSSPSPGAEFTEPHDLNATPLTEVVGNETYGAIQNGTTLWWLNTFGAGYPKNGGPSVIKDFIAWHFQDNGLFNYETKDLTWDHFVARSDEMKNASTTGMRFMDYIQVNTRIVNPDIQGCLTGIVKPFVLGPPTAGGPATALIEGGTLKNWRNIAVGTPWHNNNASSVNDPSRLIVRGARFAPISSGTGPKYDFDMTKVNNDHDNYVALDEVLVYDFNGVPGDNFQVYYLEQAPDFKLPLSIYRGTTKLRSGEYLEVLAGVPFNPAVGPVDPNGSPLPADGLTNAQAYVLYTPANLAKINAVNMPRAWAGTITPCLESRPSIHGFVCPLYLPPPPIAPPTLTISRPLMNEIVRSSTVTVTYQKGGDLTGVDHVHLQLDSDPEVQDLDFDGIYIFTGVSDGVHTLTAYLARADHSRLTNPEATAAVTFSVVTTIVNQPPVVNAGADQTVGLSTGVALTGTVTDDGLPNPPGVVTVTWSRVSGSGTVTFANGVSATTTATFSAAGSYVLRLTANDSALSASDDLTVTVSSTPPPPVGGGLVAAYNFEEGTGSSITDYSGNSHAGVISGAMWAAGRYGQALSFDGVNDWVTINDTNALDLTNAVTLEAWVNPTVVSGWRTAVYKERDVYYLYAVTPTRNAPACGANIGGYREVYGPSALLANTWTHVAGTYDGTTQRLYVNGVEVANRPQSGPITVGSGPLRLGGNATFGEYFAGLLDDVRVYSRALSTSEIQADMNTPVTPPVVKGIKGDANKDGGFDLADVNEMIKWLAGLKAWPAAGDPGLVAADVNCDTEADLADVNLMIKDLAGMAPLPAC